MPGQIVICWSRRGSRKTGELLLEKGAKRVVTTTSSGPFHTSLLGLRQQNNWRKIETHNNLMNRHLTTEQYKRLKNFHSKEEMQCHCHLLQVMSQLYWEGQC